MSFKCEECVGYMQCKAENVDCYKVGDIFEKVRFRSYLVAKKKVKKTGLRHRSSPPYINIYTMNRTYTIEVQSPVFCGVLPSLLHVKVLRG